MTIRSNTLTPEQQAGVNVGAPEMKIKAIAPWFGGKRTLAPVIIEELGKHRAYWEPFCGSMAVLLAKEPSTFETVNDLNGDLINLARVLRDGRLALELYARLSRMLMHEGLFHEAAASHRARGRPEAPEPPSVDRAYEYFICSWMGRNGVAGTSSYNQGFCVRYTKNGGHAATRWASAIDSIPAWHQRMAVTTILSRDGIELCQRIEDADGVVIYADPPYLVKGAKYIHDFDDQKWWELPDGSIKKSAALPDCKAIKITAHYALAKTLARFQKTRVVVSYYDHSDLAELYPGWTKRHTPTTKAMVNQGMRDIKGSTVAPEVLLINGPSYSPAKSSEGNVTE